VHNNNYKIESSKDLDITLGEIGWELSDYIKNHSEFSRQVLKSVVDYYVNGFTDIFKDSWLVLLLKGLNNSDVNWLLPQKAIYSLAKSELIDLTNLNFRKWSWQQMNQQRIALLESNDISNLDPSKWSAEQMDQQVLALKNGYDISNLDPSKWSLDNLRDYIELDRSKWSSDHLNILDKAVVDNIYIGNLDPSKWLDRQMEQQVLALKDGYDISDLDPNKFTSDHMQDILNRLDTLTKSGWSHEQTKKQIIALKIGLDLSNLDPSKWSAEQMYQQFQALYIGLDLSNLDPSKWKHEHMSVQINALKDGIDISYLDPRKFDQGNWTGLDEALRYYISRGEGCEGIVDKGYRHRCYRPYGIEQLPYTINSIPKGYTAINISLEKSFEKTMKHLSSIGFQLLYFVKHKDEFTPEVINKIIQHFIPDFKDAYISEKACMLYLSKGLSLKLDNWTMRQRAIQAIALKYGYDISKLDPSKWSAQQIYQQVQALKNGKDISELDPSKWSWKKMHLCIEYPHLSSLDPSKWHYLQLCLCARHPEVATLDPLKYSLIQMKAIIKGGDSNVK